MPLHSASATHHHPTHYQNSYQPQISDLIHVTPPKSPTCASLPPLPLPFVSYNVKASKLVLPPTPPLPPPPPPPRGIYTPSYPLLRPSSNSPRIPYLRSLITPRLEPPSTHISRSIFEARPCQWDIPRLTRRRRDHLQHDIVHISTSLSSLSSSSSSSSTSLSPHDSVS
ncbi:hypothetical protein BKA64DRAFT_238459 [Cadophora sp. MPI-SDFR-AT-0126]|nr:hypothetical protein BKA64DRAFT_238459 [Leotiomycetes sp. MPI-SDFR-AT-0126]